MAIKKNRKQRREFRRNLLRYMNLHKKKAGKVHGDKKGNKAFGKKTDLGSYKTLKVIPTHLRGKVKCSEYGVKI